MKKTTLWFRHDQDAFGDPKMNRLVRAHGMAGYGIFFRLIEKSRAQTNYSLKTSQIPDFAFEMHIDEKVVLDIVANFELFIVEGDSFHSARLRADMWIYDEKRKRQSEAGTKGNEIRWQSGSDRVAIKKPSGSDRKKRREDKSIEYINIAFDIFWELYDKKKGDKAKIEKIWNSLTEQTRQEIMDYIPKYKISTVKKFRQYPATFLNNKTWNDELDEIGNGKAKQNGYHEQAAPSLKD